MTPPSKNSKIFDLVAHIALWLLLLLQQTGQASSTLPVITTPYLSNLLPFPTVTAIHRDIHGVLWLGSEQGLYRYDGSELRVFGSERSGADWIPSSDIRDIAEDRSGKIYVAAFSAGLLVWNAERDSFEGATEVEDGLDRNLVSIFIGDSDIIWGATDDHIFKYDQKILSSRGLLTGKIVSSSNGAPYSFVEDRVGNLIIGKANHISIHSIADGRTDSVDLYKSTFPEDYRVTALELDNHGNIFVGTDSGNVAALEPSGINIIHEVKIPDTKSTYVRDFQIAGETLLIATDNGLYSADLNLSDIKNISDSGWGLRNTDIYCLLLDEAHVWIGTFGGLELLTYSPFQLFTQNNSQVSGDILAFEKDLNGQLWVGTYKGLYIYDEETLQHSSFDLSTFYPAPSDDRITSIKAIDDKLWLGFYRGGISVLDTLESKAFHPMPTEFENSSVTKILEDSERDEVWIATYDHGIFKIGKEGIKHLALESDSTESRIIEILISKSRMVLAASDDNIYKYDSASESFKRLDFEFGSSDINPTIYSLAESTNGDIWFGTFSRGVYIWSAEDIQSRVNILTHMDVDNALKRATIYDIEFDSLGRAWCSTQSGIALLDDGGRLIRKFGEKDGLQGNDFNLGAALSSIDGSFYFGGSNGYNKFYPEDMVFATPSIHTSITSIMFHERNHNNIGREKEITEVTLTQSDNFVTIEFSVFELIDPLNVQFKYKLENFDDDWIHSGSRNYATYTQLPPGDYIFRVHGANSSGIWDEEGASINLRVLPSPWLTAWAYCGYLLIFALFIWIVLRIHHSYALAKGRNALLEEIQEIENRAEDDLQEQLELQDEILEATHRHNTSTLLLVNDIFSHAANHIRSHSGINTPASGKMRMTALSLLEQNVYYQTDGPTINLKGFAELAISELLVNSSVPPERIITINELPDQLIPSEHGSPLGLILFELLENCIQHAFSPDSPVNYIHLKLTTLSSQEEPERLYQLIVKDNGLGFHDDFDVNQTYLNGLRLVDSIVTRLGGSIKVVSKAGAAITVLLPFEPLP